MRVYAYLVVRVVLATWLCGHSSGRLSVINEIEEDGWQAKSQYPLADCFEMVRELVAQCGSPFNSCRNQCGRHSMKDGDNSLKTCSCDKYCLVYEDCCADLAYMCPAVEREALVVNQTVTFGISCPDVHPFIDTCPHWTDLDAWDNRSTPEQTALLDLFGSNPVVDNRTSLTYKNISYYVCNTNYAPLNNESLGHLNTTRRDESLRLCYIDSVLHCKAGFSTKDTKCPLQAINFNMKDVCDRLSSKQARTSLVKYIHTYKEDAFDVGDIGMEDVDFRKVDIFELFNSSCTFRYRISRPTNTSRAQFSILYSLQVIMSLSMENVGGTLDWCFGADTWRDCVEPCARHEVRKDGQCVPVRTIDIDFRLPQKVREGCPRTYFLNRFIHFMVYLTKFIDMASVAPNPESDDEVKIRFSVNSAHAETAMSDPYLRPQLQAMFFWMDDYLGQTSTDTFQVCVDRADVLCKVFRFKDNKRPPYLVSVRGQLEDPWPTSLPNNSDVCCFCKQFMQTLHSDFLACDVVDFSSLARLAGSLFNSLLRANLNYNDVVPVLGLVNWYDQCVKQSSNRIKYMTGSCHTSRCGVPETQFLDHNNPSVENTKSEHPGNLILKSDSGGSMGRQKDQFFHSLGAAKEEKQTTTAVPNGQITAHTQNVWLVIWPLIVVVANG